MPVLITEYPKWIDDVLVESEDHEVQLNNQEEKDRMVKELKEKYGKDVDLRSYKGAGGFGGLKAYYEAVVSGEGKNKD